MRKRKHYFLVWPPPALQHTHTIATKHRRIPPTFRQHTYQEPGKPEAALGPSSCLGQWDGLGSQYKWQAGQAANISLKDQQAEPRAGGAGWDLGRSPTSLYQCLSGGPPCGRLRAATSPTGEEKAELGELRTASREIGWRGRQRNMDKLACGLVEWAELNWAKFPSVQCFSVNVDAVVLPGD